jgi:hypothetical protein
MDGIRESNRLLPDRWAESSMVAYLLGQLPQDSAAELEDAFFADEELFAALRSVETELIHAYLRGDYGQVRAFQKSTRDTQPAGQKVRGRMCRESEPAVSSRPLVAWFFLRPAAMKFALLACRPGRWFRLLFIALRESRPRVRGLQRFVGARAASTCRARLALIDRVRAPETAVPGNAGQALRIELRASRGRMPTTPYFRSDGTRFGAAECLGGEHAVRNFCRGFEPQ